MKLDKLKDSIKKQKEVNADTLVATNALRNFNNNFSIIGMMQEPHSKRRDSLGK